MTDPESGQMGLGGFEPPKPTDRLFFAVFPDAAAAARIADLARELRELHGLRGKPLQADRFHVTLHHLGDYAGVPDDLVAKAGEAARRVDKAAFEVAFDSASSFSRQPRNRPFVLRGDTGVAELDDFQSALGTAMAAVGLNRLVERKFTAHVTLLYDDRAVAPQPVERIAWPAREFVLVHSLLGRTEHRILGRWPLAAAVGGLGRLRVSCVRRTSAALLFSLRAEAGGAASRFSTWHGVCVSHRCGSQFRAARP